MKKLIYTSIFIMLICSHSFGQNDENKKENKEINCGILSVDGPSTAINPNDLQRFTLKLEKSDFNDNELKIKWSVDKGRIVSGQGTKTVWIADTNLSSPPTATVEVKMGDICKLSASETGVICGCKVGEPILFDEIGKMSEKAVKKQVKLFLEKLSKEKTAQGYAINYGTSSRIQKREKIFKDLMKKREMTLDTLIFVNAGKEKQIRTRLWIVPQGADASKIE